MKAMILAAGLGTRLKPITDTKPKALVEVDGVTMLERLILTLRSQGFDHITVNVHHFGDQIIEFLKLKNFNVDIYISDETDQLLDTGGGIVKAMPLLFGNDDQPVLFHNVDILSNAPLEVIMGDIQNQNEDIVLMVSSRDSSRKIIFNEEMELTGWHDLKSDVFKFVGNPSENDREMAFSGIYAMSKKAVEEMKDLMGERKFSVMDYFLSPLRKTKVKGLLQENLKLLDIGKPASLLQAPKLLNELNTFLN